MAAVRGHQAYSVLRARASLAGRGMLLENRKAFAGRMRPVLEQGRIWFGRGFLWQPEHSQKLYELSKIDAARLIPPLWITRRLLGRSIKDPDTIGQGFIHGVSLTESDLTVAEKNARRRNAHRGDDAGRKRRAAHVTHYRVGPAGRHGDCA